MKNLVRAAALALLAAPLVLSSSCKKDEYALEGAVPASDFTYTLNTVGLTTTATFTATNTDGYLYQWNFGDGTIASGPTATHVYSSSGTVKAQLVTIYRGGNSFSAQKDVTLPSTSALVKAYLTGTTSKTWKLDNSVAAAIVVGPDDANPTQYYAGGAAGSLPACQADDEYTFSASNTFTYDAKGQTFVAGGACDTPRNVSTPFTFGNATGAGLAQITLASATPRPFIGVTDAPDLIYRVIAIDAQRMTLRAGSPTAGVVFTMKMIVK
ncbi:PKD domain-containing protein [Hymenobacter convexus]|uniref:PKD domain-containing protein n=1 Tax=Hymenobacter sp. CA1UV-4 TaxID=3063782 RepID=UPI002712C11C|nr:PKD domain-containing protein [Hymenobacter sp. CA1UV-4]MDO7850215.1 PKD domain-containing protein [Hymenobacter sp. CA1UV-4]